MLTDDWTQSTYCTSGDCVEARATADGSVEVRDSKQNGTGPVLAFTADEWTAFLAGANDGQFKL